MKKLLILVALASLCAAARAQGDTVPQPGQGELKEDRFFRPGAYKKRTAQPAPGSEGVSEEVSEEVVVFKVKGNRWFDFSKDGHWAGINVNYSGLIGGLDHWAMPAGAESMATEANSIGVQFNLFDMTFYRYRSLVLFTGLGVEINNFRFSDNVTLRSDNGVTLPEPVVFEDVAKSKLVTTYLNLPVMAELSLGGKGKGYVNFGGVVGWRMSGHTKVKYEMGGQTYKLKQDAKDLNLANFHAGICIGGGYSHFGLAVSYYPTQIFKDGHGPYVQQVNIGISLTY